MAAVPVDTVIGTRTGVPIAPRRVHLRRRLMAVALLSPSMLFLAMFFALPALGLISYSFLTQAADGNVGPPLTLEHYRHFFATPLYSRVLRTTIEISLITTGLAI